MICTICQQVITTIGSLSLDTKTATCLPCFVEKKKQDQQATFVKSANQLIGRSKKKTFVTDGGMIFEKDNSGNFYHNGEKVSAQSMHRELKAHGKVYEATSPHVRKFAEQQQAAYKAQTR